MGIRSRRGSISRPTTAVTGELALESSNGNVGSSRLPTDLFSRARQARLRVISVAGFRIRQRDTGYLPGPKMFTFTYQECEQR